MSTATLASYARADTSLRELVALAVLDAGVPGDLDAALALADRLLPEVLRLRQNVAAVQGNEVRALLGSMADVPGARYYPQTALESVVLEAAGLHPRRESPAIVEVMDDATRELARVRTAPYLMPEEPAIIAEVQRRLTGGVGQHVRSAGRDLVIDAARNNGAGWARRLSGAENCGFCAMLASRGAVYGQDSVRFQSHPHCDCTAELVTDADSWPGRADAEMLRTIWNRSTGLSGFTQTLREEGARYGLAAT